MLNTFYLYKLRIRVQVLLVFLSNFYEFHPKWLIIKSLVDSNRVRNSIRPFFYYYYYFILAFIATHPDAITQQSKAFPPAALWTPCFQTQRGEHRSAHPWGKHREGNRKAAGMAPTYLWLHRFIAFGAKAVEQPDAHRHQQHEGCLWSGFVSGAAPGQHSPTLGTKQGWEWIWRRPLWLPPGWQVLHSTKNMRKISNSWLVIIPIISWGFLVLSAVPFPEDHKSRLGS